MAINLVTELHKLTKIEKLKIANELLDDVYGDFDNSSTGESAEKLMNARLKEFERGGSSAVSFDDFRKKRSEAKD